MPVMPIHAGATPESPAGFCRAHQSHDRATGIQSASCFCLCVSITQTNVEPGASKWAPYRVTNLTAIMTWMLHYGGFLFPFVRCGYCLWSLFVNMAAYTRNTLLQEQVVQISDAGWKNVLLFTCNSEHFATTRTTTASLKMGQRCTKCYLPARALMGNHPITLLLGFLVLFLFAGKLRMWNWTPVARRLHKRTQSTVTNSRPSGRDAIVEANCNIKTQTMALPFQREGGWRDGAWAYLNKTACRQGAQALKRVVDGDNGIFALLRSEWLFKYGE